ncbi:MAG: transcription antitermination factor NusB [Sandaracinaceae bacterium]|nr:transcription antitermination factor NusB [Sandaracinaceae bacterium]
MGARVGTRRRAREAALQMLYQMDLSGASPEETVALFWRHLAFCEEEGEGREELSHEGIDFANRAVLGYAAHREEIDNIIRRVSQNWRLERMARVDRNVIRLGVWELLWCPETPHKVTINEAVELAKRFGSEQSAAFVNGVLDRVASEYAKGKKEEKASDKEPAKNS